MKKASTKGIEKDLEELEGITIRIRKGIEKIVNTIPANSLVNENHVITIQNIRRDLRDSSEQLQRWLGL